MFEEEVVCIYMYCIFDMEVGFIFEWKDMFVFVIVIDYWRLLVSLFFFDVIRVVWVDEVIYRFVNYFLVNLD